MITQADLRTHIGRRPFSPFRVTLHTGEAIDVTRVAQAVVMPNRLVVGMNDDRFRWIWLQEIARVDPVELKRAS